MSWGLQRFFLGRSVVPVPPQHPFFFRTLSPWPASMIATFDCAVGSRLTRLFCEAFRFFRGDYPCFGYIPETRPGFLYVIIIFLSKLCSL